ncbi:MAG: hypothetical protein RR565_02380 [Erysipelothrix sp.]
MLNYFKAEFYRIFHKKSFYIFLASCSVLFIAVTFIASGQIKSGLDYAQFMGFITQMIPIFIGIYTFGLIYGDELRSKSMQTAIGFGHTRFEIIINKLFVSFALLLISYIVMMIHVMILPFFLGFNLNSEVAGMIAFQFFTPLFQTFIYFSIASIMAFYTQKATSAMLTFVLLATGTINMIMSLIVGQKFLVNLFGNLQPYLLTNIISQINAGFFNHNLSADLFIGPILYLAVSIAIATLLFNRKELEF